MPSINQYDLFIYDLQGNIVFTFPEKITEISKSVKEVENTVIQSRKISFVDLYQNETTQKIFMGLMAPIFNNDSDQKITGFVYLRIDPALYLFPFLQQWPNDSKSAETLLVRKEGENVLFLNNLRFLQNSALTKTLSLTKTETPAVQAVLGRIGFFEGLDYRDVPVFSELRSIPNSPWFLVARIDKKEVLAPIVEKEKQMISLFGLLTLFIGLVLLLIWRIQYKSYRKEQEAISKINREYEESIRVSNENTNQYLTLVGSIIVVINKDQTVTLINDAGCKLLGYSKEDIIGKNWFEHFLPSTDVDEVKKVFNSIMSGLMDNVEFFENIVVTKSGELRDIAWHNGIIRDKNKSIIASISSGEDITDRKKAEEALKQLNEELETRVRSRTMELENSNKELESFAYSVAHDLRAPLRSIDGFSNILLEDYQSALDEEGVRILEIIRNSSQKMDHLIFDLLAMSKISRIDIKKELIEMKTLALSVYDEFISPDEKEKIKFVIDELPKAYGDSTLIRQVWVNLISNAIKFTSTKENRSIRIHGFSEINDAVYSIQDNGVGFNPDYKNKLFNAFQRLHSSSEFEGTGIGLAIVERIIRRHGGKVWADGEDGVGATFYFSLPTATGK